MQEEFLDPVCGVMVLPTNARGWRVYHGRTHYFCSSEHMEIFDRDPDKYVARQQIPNTGQGSSASETKSYKRRSIGISKPE
jgi:YHS domain-containing protein